MEKLKIQNLSLKLKDRRNWLYILALAVFAAALAVRLPYISHGLDQWDAVHYKDSLVQMRFDRPAKWPVLLFFQKGLWLVAHNLTAAEILSLTNIILAAALLAIFFAVVSRISKSYITGLILTIGLFFMPLFAVYSIVGMQDMAQTFGITLAAALLLKFCYAKNLKWLYAASAVAGLVVGIKLTLVLFVPSLVLAIVLLTKFDLKVYLKIIGIFILGILVWLVPEHFIKSGGEGSFTFFFQQVHAFSPSKLGYWKKAGDYVLLSGYRFKDGMFYWLPAIWLLVYLLSKRQKKSVSLGPIIALLGVFTGLVVSYGLHKVLGINYWHTFLTLAILTAAALVYEIVKLLSGIKKYLKNLKDSPREVAILSLTLLVACYLVFEYISAGTVARYLLPIVPPLLFLMLLLTNLKGWKSSIFVLILVAWSFWGCTFAHTQKIISSFKTLDTRSSVALYAKAHKGTYYSFDVSLAAYFQTYNVNSKLKSLIGYGCSGISLNQTDYLIFNGKIPQRFINGCPQAHFIKLANFQRHEEVIEDSVGNIGYFIYRLKPQN